MTFAILDGNRMWKTMRGARLVGLGTLRHPFGDDLLAAPRAWPAVNPAATVSEPLRFHFPSLRPLPLCFSAFKTMLRADS